MKVLFLEDDRRLNEVVLRGLRGEGHVVDGAATLEEARWLIGEFLYDVLLLDVMLPDGDAYAFCTELREGGCGTPVLLLTARDSVPDRVRGLDVGADDYLIKPFAFEELLARIRALQRRGEVRRPVQLQVGGLRIDPARHEAWLAERQLRLTSREFALLELFARRPGEVLTRARILEDGWDFAFEGTPRIIDVYVSQLRRHLGLSLRAPRLETVRGVGYVLRPPKARRRGPGKAVPAPASG